MPVDPASPSYIFVQALLGEAPDPQQVARFNPEWQELIQAAQSATPVARRATLLLAKAGQANGDRLLAALRAPDPPEEQPWPEPQPFGRPHLPEFPHRVLPHWLGNIVRAEARATQTPTDLSGMLALAVLSAACAGRAILNPWGDWLEPLNLYLMVALPPGHRKSAVYASIVQPLQQYEADAARDAAPQIAHARRVRHAAEQALLRAETALALATDDADRDALIQLAQRRADDLAATDNPVLPRLIVDDCSPERLATLLYQQGGRLAILSPEGGIFDLIAGRYSTTGAPNLDHFLKGHAGDPIIVDRVSRPGEIIPRPALTIGLAIQPEVLRALSQRPGFHGRGLLARFLYAVPNATLGHRVIDTHPVPESLRAAYRCHIRTLLQSPLPTPCMRDASGEDLLPFPHPRGRGLGGRGSSPDDNPPLSRHHAPAPILPFSDAAAERLREFARTIEPRLAPTGDLGPIVDWGSKLVGAVARISGLLHLAELAPYLPHPEHRQDLGTAASQFPLPIAMERGLGGGAAPVTPGAVDAAIILADYLAQHAQAAYTAMGINGPTIAQAPLLLDWLRRARPETFTRRDAQRAIGPRLRSAWDLDDALEQLEQHGYIRSSPTPRHPGQGRPPGPTYHVHPGLARWPAPPPPRTGEGAGG